MSQLIHNQQGRWVGGASSIEIGLRAGTRRKKREPSALEANQGGKNKNASSRPEVRGRG